MTQTHTARTRLRGRARLTVEMGLYGLIFALALALRLLTVGRWPLLDGEASLALAAWRFAHGLPTSLRGYSPLLFNWNALLCFLTGGSDGLMRSLSILFGSALVLWPYRLRRNLGRIGALAAAIMLAISPSGVYFSRIADGSVIVAFCALGFVAVTTHYLRQPQLAPGQVGQTNSDILIGAGLLMVALLAGPSVYTLLAVLLTFPVMLWLRAPVRKDTAALDEVQQAWHAVTADTLSLRWALLLAALILLTFGAGITLNPLGLQMALDQFGQWVGGFALLRGAWYRAALLLFVYEGLPLVLGAAGLLLERERTDVFTLLLRHWAIFTLVFSVVPGYRPPNSILLITLPLILAGGQAIEQLWKVMRSTLAEPLLWVLVAVSLFVCAAGLIQFVTYLAVPSQTYLLRMAALFVFAVSIYALVWSLSGREIPVRAAVVFVLLLLLIGGIRAEARVNYARARDPIEPLVGTTVSPDVLVLARKAAEFSSRLLGDPRVMDWQVDASLEVPLGWYLRSFERVSYVTHTPASPEAGGVILPAAASAPAKYVGLRFALHLTWPGGRHALVDWLRWWTGQQPAFTKPQRDEVMLWVRAPEASTY
jgi:uncharacterized protein (TIGR03663 family)